MKSNVFLLKKNRHIITRVVLGAMGCMDACRCMGVDPKQRQSLYNFIGRIKNRTQHWPPFNDSSTSASTECTLETSSVAMSGEESNVADHDNSGEIENSENLSDNSGTMPECDGVQTSTQTE